MSDIEEKSKGGRPTKFNSQLSEKIIELTEKGKTTEEIAEIIGVNPRTIYYWYSSKPEFFQAVKESRQVADELVEASLFHRAIGYSHKEEKVFCDKGEIITHETVKHYPPDTASAIFWLKNRKPEEWREKAESVQVNVQNNVSQNVTVDVVDLEERIKQLKGEDEDE